MIVWDRGTYSPDENGELSFEDRGRAEARMKEALDKGKISVLLRGEKMRGSWTLVKMKGRGNNWLLIKHRDDQACTGRDILNDESSVLSGLTVADLKTGQTPVRHAPAALKPEELSSAVKKAFPRKLSPMLATLSTGKFPGEGWVFEPKLDGYRVLGLLDAGKVKLISRRGIDISEYYPSLIEAVKKQPAAQAVFDGELIALDKNGKSCFQCLQGYLKSMGRKGEEDGEMPSALMYYVFDVLYLDGHDLRNVPFEQRRALLKSVLAEDREIKLMETFRGDGEKVYRAALDNGLEGIIGKRADSRYLPGKRSPDWLKFKGVKSDDFIVAGYTRGTGARSATFGSLVMGYYDEKKDLRYAGNVGTGFDNKALNSMKEKLDGLKMDKSPFKEAISLGRTDVTWVKPETVIEVKYSEWTRDGKLRAPVFLRVREDKAAETVRIVRSPDVAPKAGESGSGKDAVLEQLENGKADFLLEVEGWKLPVSKLDKPLFPETGGRRALTKRDLLIYLYRVSGHILPHLQDRPLSLNRFPDGVGGEHFFQKHYEPVPEFVETVPITTRGTPVRDYLLCNNTATLLWLGQIADLEIHTWFSRTTPGHDLAEVKNKGGDYYTRFPDFIIFDLDPYIYSGKEGKGEEPELNRKAFRKTCEVALELKDTLARLSLTAFVKTSGKTGLHVFVPIVRNLDYRATKSAAEVLSRYLVQRNPAGLTMEWAVEKRKGKIFLDYNQNVRGKTLASVYSPRPVPEASVSVPLQWDELRQIYPTDFTILNVPERLGKTGDLWHGIFDARVDIERLVADMGKSPGG